jgi:hypothetical protein
MCEDFLEISTIHSLLIAVIGSLTSLDFDFKVRQI